jgi:hypothetical protein
MATSMAYAYVNVGDGKSRASTCRPIAYSRRSQERKRLLTVPSNPKRKERNRSGINILGRLHDASDSNPLTLL